MTASGFALKGLPSAFFVLLCLQARQAEAGDYEVVYAIDIRGEKATGQSAECTYRYPCRLKFGNSRKSITIFFTRPKREFSVSIDNGRGVRCYFSDGDKFARMDAAKPFHRLPVFEGRRRHGNEWVMNRKIGELFLGLRNLRPSPRNGP